MQVKLIDTFPHFGELGPSEIIAMGGFGTVSAEDFLEMYRKENREEIRKKVKDILIKAIVRGYASMTTSTALLFSIKGSRVLDLFVTAFPFGSYMVLSQRYVPVDRPEVPDWVGREVRNLVEEEIRVYNELVEMGIRREEARGVLGLGTPTHMLAVLSVESVSSMIKWGGDHPEIEEFLDLLAKEVRGSDERELLTATLNAPTMGGPFPHPFHREQLDADKLRVESYSWTGDTTGVDRVKELMEKIKGEPPENWQEMVRNTVELSKVAHRHANEVWITFSARIPITTFNELKRHRTVPIEVESIYRAMERGDFYVYPSVRNLPDALRAYEWVIDEFNRLDAPECERVYALPQSVKINVRFTLNFAQLTAPSLFFRMRSCDRAEVSMKQLVRQIPYVVKGIPGYGEKLFDVLTGELNGSRVPLPKCVVGACPEPEYCPLVRAIRPSYDDATHTRIKRSRKEVLS